MAITTLALPAVVEAINANITVAESVGTQEGDYHFVFIGHRSAIGYDAPAGWTKLLDESSGNVSTTTSTSIASGEVFYIKRGASAPALTFTKQAGTGDIARARLITVRGVDQTSPIASSTSRTLAANGTTVATSANLTGDVDDYLLAFVCAADNLTISNPQINTGTPVALTSHVTGGSNNGADMASMIAGGLLTAAINNTVQATLAGSSRHMIGAVVLAPEPPPPSPSTRHLVIGSATSTSYNRVRSAVAYSGDLDITFEMTPTAKPGIEDYHCPNFWWGADAEFTVGTKIEFTPGYLHYALPTASEFNAQTTVLDTTYKYRITQVGSVFTIYLNDVQLDTFTDAAVDTTSCYFGFSTLECETEFDNITGAVSENFEAVTPGTYDLAAIGSNFYAAAGGEIEVVSTTVTQNLTAGTTTQANEAPGAAMGQTRVLTAATTAQANTSTSGEIGQTRILTGAPSIQDNSSASAAVGQTHNLTGATAVQDNAASGAAITQVHNLTGSTTTQGNTSTSGTISSDEPLAGAVTTQSNSSSSGAITQVHNLTAGATTQANSAISGAIEQTQIMAGAPSIQANTSTSGEFTEARNLAAGVTVQENVATGMSLTGVHMLAGDITVQSNQAEGGAIIIGKLPPPTAARYARPYDVTSNTGWLASTGDDLTDLINEAAPDPAGFIYATEPAIVDIELGPVADPGSSTGQVMRYQAWSEDGSSLVVRLKQGASTVATWNHDNLPTVPTVFERELTNGEANAITDYSILRIEFEAL